jgi:membrane protein YqaA with SNARE-associated domain
MSLFTTLYQWTQLTFLPLGNMGLFIVAFLESSFFPLPPDFLLVIMALNAPESALIFALIATIGSVLGGIFGYYIGYVGKEKVVKKFIDDDKINKVHKLFEKYESWAIFIAGFTPIPYKVFTIAGGFFYIDFKKFVIASFLSRGLRFFIEAILIILYGETILKFLGSYFNLFSLIAVVLAILAYIAYKYREKIKW